MTRRGRLNKNQEIPAHRRWLYGRNHDQMGDTDKFISPHGLIEESPHKGVADRERNHAKRFFSDSCGSVNR
jgi:hypothetical protein